MNESYNKPFPKDTILQIQIDSLYAPNEKVKVISTCDNGMGYWLQECYIIEKDRNILMIPHIIERVVELGTTVVYHSLSKHEQNLPKITTRELLLFTGYCPICMEDSEEIVHFTCNGKHNICNSCLKNYIDHNRRFNINKITCILCRKNCSIE